MNFNDFNTVYDYLTEHKYFTEMELNLVCSLNGMSLETLNDVIYIRYGYRNIEQLIDSEED